MRRVVRSKVLYSYGDYCSALILTYDPGVGKLMMEREQK